MKKTFRIASLTFLCCASAAFVSGQRFYPIDSAPASDSESAAFAGENDGERSPQKEAEFELPPQGEFDTGEMFGGEEGDFPPPPPPPEFGEFEEFGEFGGMGGQEFGEFETGEFEPGEFGGEPAEIDEL